MRVLGLATVLCCAAVAASGCGSGETRTTTVTKIDSSASAQKQAAAGDRGDGGPGTGGYPAQLRRNFLASCENQINASADGCECSLAYLEEHVSVDRFISAEQAISSGGTAPQWLYDAIDACR